MAQAAQTKILEGAVGDTMCGLKHQVGNISDKECTLNCVRTGSQYALVVGDALYELNGKPSELEKLAGGRRK